MRHAVLFALACLPAHAETFAFGHPADPHAPARTVAIVIDGPRFIPSTLAARPGETVRFRIKNPGDLAHEFVLGDAVLQQSHRREMQAMAGQKDMAMDDDPNAVTVPAHGTAELAWTFTRAGAVEYDCDIPGHYEAGMKGVITVK